MVTHSTACAMFVPAEGDLPAYTLRLSSRAGSVRLRVTAHEGLVVVVPTSMADFAPAEALRDRREWIEAATAEFAERRALLTAAPESLLPREIAFAATRERWLVVYRPSAGAANARIEDGAVVVRGGESDAEERLRALRRWLQRAAVDRLPPMLARESEAVGLHPARVGVRGQRARWGGCSPSGSVTLNRCLLFLPPELVRAVMLHELAHLAHPNHSAAFWRELARLDPDARSHHAAIRAARDSIPPWAEP